MPLAQSVPSVVERHASRLDALTLDPTLTHDVATYQVSTLSSRRVRSKKHRSSHFSMVVSLPRAWCLLQPSPNPLCGLPRFWPTEARGSTLIGTHGSSGPAWPGLRPYSRPRFSINQALGCLLPFPSTSVCVSSQTRDCRAETPRCLFRRFSGGKSNLVRASPDQLQFLSVS